MEISAKIKKLYGNSRDKAIIALGQWFGVTNPWSSDFETLGGATSKFREVLAYATAASALVCVIMLVYGGYTFITSAGDSEKVDQGNKMITASIIGMVIVFIARLVVIFIFERVIN